MLAKRWLVALAGIFLAALAWRLAYLARVSATPLAGSLRGDERLYWDWAGFLVQNHFRATNAFFLGPLYPYALAVVRVFVGQDLQAALRIQAVWGSIAVVLLADAARRLAGPTIALGIGVVLALYQMAVFFDGLVLMESFLFFLEGSLFWLWSRGVGAPSPSAPRTAAPTTRLPYDGIAIGLVIGLIAQCRATGAVLLAPALWLASRAPSPPSKLTRSVAIALTFVITALPAVIWNWRATGEFIPFTYNFGYNLYVGNNPEATGGFVWIAGPHRLSAAPASRMDGGAEADGREFLAQGRGLTLSPAQSSAYWSRQATAFMREHPGAVPALAADKLLMLWNHSEAPQIEDADLFRRLAGPLGLPVIGTFTFLGTLGLIGCAYARTPMGKALAAYLLLFTLALLPFFVTDRYRIHLVPALALLAAMGVDAFRSDWRAGIRPPAKTALWAIGAIALVAVPLADRGAPYSEWLRLRELGLRWLEHDRPDLALVELDRAIRLERELHLDSDPNLAEERASLYFHHGVALRGVGRIDEALVWLQRAVDLAPQNPRFVRTLGDAYRVHGREREGDSLIRSLGSLVGGRPEALVSEGWRAAREGRMAEAESLFTQAVESDPRLHGAWGALIRVQVELEEFDRARVTLEKARRAGLPDDALHAHEALVLAMTGDTAGARRALEQVPHNAVEGDPILARVVSRVAQLIGAAR